MTLLSSTHEPCPEAASFLHREPVLRAPGAIPHGRIVAATRETRPAIEAFVAQRFAEVYGARLHTFLPHLYGFEDDDGRLIAAFGLRRADEGPLFLEQYLDEPIEELVGRAAHARVPRGRITEIGNLAGRTPGSLRAMIPAVAALLNRNGVRWVGFTGTVRVCNGFRRLGLPLSIACPADIRRLPESERAGWGSYYEHDPVVMLGDVSHGTRGVRRLVEGPRGVGIELAALDLP